MQKLNLINRVASLASSINNIQYIIDCLTDSDYFKNDLDGNFVNECYLPIVELFIKEQIMNNPMTAWQMKSMEDDEIMNSILDFIYKQYLKILI